MNIVLLEPEIPANTGNIGRSCVASGATLHLIKPLGFSIDDRDIKRAGLDYWPALKVRYYSNFLDFIANNNALIYMVTTKAKTVYTDAQFTKDSFIMFGKESAGIPETILKDYRAECIRIPMTPGSRSLNLSNAVSIVMYEALRQNDFIGLQKSGHLF